MLKLEPLNAGGRTYRMTDKSFPVHVKHIRVIDISLKEVATRRSGRIASRYAPTSLFELSEKDRDRIHGCLSADAV